MNEFPGKMLMYADVGPAIGTRRLNRCLTLASSWARLGGTVELVCRQLPGTLRRRVKQLGIALHEFPASAAMESKPFDWTILENEPPPAWLVIDGPGFASPRRFEQGLGKGIRVLNIDADEGNGVHGDRTTHLPEHADDAVSPRQLEIDTVRGTEFALLSTASEEKVDTRRQPKQVRRLLALFGGTNGTAAASGVLAALNQLDSVCLSLDLFVGRESADPGPFQQQVRDSHHHIRFHRNPDRIAAILPQADLAICQDLTHFVDLAYHGIPMVTLNKNDCLNNPHEGRSLSGAAIMLKGASDPENLQDRLRAVIRDRELRQSLSQQGQQLVDGCGADRLARRMAVQQFKLRPATLNDSHVLYQWRMDPEVRALCLESEHVSMETHRRWLQNRIDSEPTRCCIVEDLQAKPIGLILLDYPAGTATGELTISLIPSLRGRGLGTGLIEHACRIFESRHPRAGFHAVIKPIHLHAKRAFQKAGFRPIAMTAIDGQVAIKFYRPASPGPEKQRPVTPAAFRRKAS